MADIVPLDQTPTDTLTPPTGQAGNPLGYTVTDTNFVDQIAKVLSNVIGTLTVIAGLAFIIYFVIAAVTLVTVGDDQGKLQNARTSMTQALVGIAITAAAYPLVWVITHLLGIPLTDPAELLNNYLVFFTS